VNCTTTLKRWSVLGGDEELFASVAGLFVAEAKAIAARWNRAGRRSIIRPCGAQRIP